MFDLTQSESTCMGCVKQYICKHKFTRGDPDASFNLSCKGIPKEYIAPEYLAELGMNKKMATAMLDPVTWANLFLDWHCTDPDGAHWKRKHEAGTLGALPPYEEFQAKAGKSIFHRPYQATMLRCSSKMKVFRIGRQAGKTECLCIAILHALFTNEKFQVTVIAPYQSQIDLIFTRLEELIKSNPTLHNDMLRCVKAPNYKIILKNESRVLGFTAGTRSGGDAAAARGQSGGMLVFDEADYLSPKDVNAALAIITNFPNATVWMSSTPTGRREKFYECCMSREWKEFHYPSNINPNWTEELERFFRDTLTEEGYEHEINADFSEQEAGVYQSKYVEAAQTNYCYEDMYREKGWHYAIGVDWNDTKIGVCIAVVGFNPADNCYYLVDKKIVSKSDYTQLRGCEVVRQYNKLWRPFAIYIDRGFGATQEEILTLFGHRQRAKEGKGHPDARLAHIVHAYVFGSSIEIRDPFSKQLVKKNAKAFLVENSVRRFEQQDFRYPKKEEKELYTKSLLGYIVKNISLAGVPIYQQENEAAGDHFLDAVNLALVAFTLEKTDFGQPRYGTDVVFTEALGATEFGAEKPASRSNDMGFSGGRRGHGTRAANMGAGGTDFALPRNQGLPGAHLQTSVSKSPWNWPGFEYDAPRPPTRTYREAFAAAANRLAPRRGRPAPPRRKRF